MTLTSSFQKIAETLLGNTGYGNVYIRNYARVSSQGYDITNNRTLVYIQARIYTEGAYWYSSSGTTYRITASGSLDSGTVSCNGRYEVGETVLGTISGYITHNADGTRTIHAESNFVSTPWGWNATASATNIDLPSIPRQANIKTAPDFNDEENPTITYENPAGNSVTSLQACISLTGSADDISYRDINKTGTLSYTFELTDEERNILRQATISNSRTVYFYVKTIIGDNTYYSKIAKTFTIINADPVFNDFEFEDANETTVALTGSNQDVILGYSNVKVTIPVSNKAIASKEATMQSYRFNNISVNYSDTDDVSITSEKITSGEFIVYAIDSRSNSTPKIKSAVNVINYTPLSKNTITANRENGVSKETILKFSGKIDLVNFGAVINSIKTAKYRYTIAGKENWSEYIDLELIVDENGNFSFNDYISGDIENVGFDVNNSYNIEVLIEDELSSVPFSITLGSGIPHIAYAKNGVGIMGKYDESVGGLLQVGGKSIISVDSDWVTISLITGTASDPLEVRKIGDVVNLRGRLTGISGTIQIATLPEGYIPSSSQSIFQCSNTRLQINNDGAIYTLEASGTLGINIVYFLN